MSQTWRINPDDPREIETDDDARCTVAIVEAENCEPAQVRADAQLIAAAPEMHEVLVDIRDRWLRWVTTGIQVGPNGKDRALLQRLYSVLAAVERGQ